MIIYNTETQFYILYYIYIFIACYYMNFFISQDVKLYVYNRKQKKEVPLKPWLTRFIM